MSHFTVMVIGDVGHNLAPFHEYECTGRRDEFVVPIDDTAKVRSDYEGHKDDPDYPSINVFAEEYYGMKKVPFGEEPDLEDQHKYRYYTVDENDQLLTAIQFTNPNKKWDWYQVGGRWSGYLLGKDGERHDALKKADIDIDGMRDEAQKKAEEFFDRAMKGVNESWLSWDASVEKFEKDYSKAREFYHAQPALIQIATNLGNSGFLFSKDELMPGREKFVQTRRDGAIATFALVTDRKWAQSGDMGWFGLSTPDMSADDWNELVGKFLDALPDDAVISIVDCHI